MGNEREALMSLRTAGDQEQLVLVEATCTPDFVTLECLRFLRRLPADVGSYCGTVYSTRRDVWPESR